MPPIGTSNRSSRSNDAVVAAYRPLVYSVCNRYFRRPEDVEDAAQETFVRLMRHGQTIPGPAATTWISATARSCSIDLIRRAIRERARRQRLLQNASESADDALLHDAIRHRLGQALAEVEESSRALLVERYFRNEPLSVLALRHERSVPTMSRRIAAAVIELTDVLRDGPQVAEHLGSCRLPRRARG